MRAVVLKPGHTKSPRGAYKKINAWIHPRPMKSEFLGVEGRHFFKAPIYFSLCLLNPATMLWGSPSYKESPEIDVLPTASTDCQTQEWGYFQILLAPRCCVNPSLWVFGLRSRHCRTETNFPHCALSKFLTDYQHNKQLFHATKFWSSLLHGNG